jgi:hypothetical protein
MVAKKKVASGIALAIFMNGLTLAGNLTYPIRDQFMTVGLESFEPMEIISNRLWYESPIQILQTHFSKSTRFIAVGIPNEGGLPFADRLISNFGEAQVDQSRAPIDLRSLSISDLEKLKFFVQSLSYRSLHPCPHDVDKQCTIAVGWNRERTKAPGVRMITTRINEDTYLILDDSILSLQDNDL